MFYQNKKQETMEIAEISFTQYILLYPPILSPRRFSVVRHKHQTSNYIHAKAYVPQGSVLRPILYLVYTADIPVHPNTHIATFADDTAIFSSNPNPHIVSASLRNHLSVIETWCRLWRIRINQAKCVYVTLTLRRQTCPPITFDKIPIPPANRVHYLGMYLDRGVTWNPHTRLKRTDLNRKYGLLRHLLKRNSKLSTENKLTLYNAILKPTRAYGVEVWGSAKKSNLDRIQAFQSKVLRTILDAPWGFLSDILDVRASTLKGTARPSSGSQGRSTSVTTPCP
ncbi:hypothetical protein AAG570_002156 [Ranatra chinensis]|uniref:Reverse transcriptase domain-containing protein n=1 Tax=Ranatra chinensis TaxID=642074 RepID=A0ABD0YTE9_9HEMI